MNLFHPHLRAHYPLTGWPTVSLLFKWRNWSLKRMKGQHWEGAPEKEPRCHSGLQSCNSSVAHCASLLLCGLKAAGWSWWLPLQKNSGSSQRHVVTLPCILRLLGRHLPSSLEASYYLVNDSWAFSPLCSFSHHVFIIHVDVSMVHKKCSGRGSNSPN